MKEVKLTYLQLEQQVTDIITELELYFRGKSPGAVLNITLANGRTQCAIMFVRGELYVVSSDGRESAATWVWKPSRTSRAYAFTQGPPLLQFKGINSVGVADPSTFMSLIELYYQEMRTFLSEEEPVHKGVFKVTVPEDVKIKFK